MINKAHSTSLPNPTDELGMAEEQHLNQFGSAILMRYCTQREVQQCLSHYETLEQQLIQTAFS